jgi:polysaccharide biosynthesis transport protein
MLLQKMDVRQSRNTTLIEIRVYSEDRNESANIANAIAAVYASSRQAKTRAASKASIDMLVQQAEMRKTELQEAQRVMDKMRKELGVADIDVGGSLVQVMEPETVRRIEAERLNAESNATLYRTMLQKLEGLPKMQLRETLPTVQPDDQLSAMLRTLTEANNSLAAKTDLGPENTQIKALKALIEKVNDQIDARVQGLTNALGVLASSHEMRALTLQSKVNEAKDKDSANMEKYRPYFAAKRDVETHQRIFDAIELRILQEQVDSSLPKKSIVRVTDRAEPSLRPVRPNVPLNIALGVIVGLVMGFGLAFFIEYLDTSVKTIDDVERALQAPVLGVIPQNVGALIEEGPESPHAEAYRVLRTNVLFSRKDPAMNSLTVVSGGAGEGKSTTIFNLATVFAQNGQRVLIVDSDLRRPSLHKLMNVSNSLGLTNYLLNQNTLEEVIQTTTLPNLHFLASGKLPSSSLGILNSVQMKEFIAEAKRRYDFVFFDSPPIMGVSDASILASEVDLSLLVIQYRKYPQAMTLRAKQMVEKVGGHLLGVVLNNINISQDSYYYYYSGYYYDYYSKHDDDAPKKNGAAKTPGSDRGTSVEIKNKY